MQELQVCVNVIFNCDTLVVLVVIMHGFGSLMMMLMVVANHTLLDESSESISLLSEV